MANLPASFGKMGFVKPEQARKVAGAKNRRLMILSEGEANTGKTEFLYTCPGPGLILTLDRGFDAACDNPTPPESRRDDFAMKIIKVPTFAPGQDPKLWQPYWTDFYNAYKECLANPDALTVALDGDNVSWSLQRLAEHGKLTGVFPQTKYTGVYDARRSMYFRAFDSGKIIVSTNMLRDEFEVMLDASGNPIMDNGEPKKKRTGEKVSQGFPDNQYLWQIRIRHLYTPKTFNKTLKQWLPAKWGLKIIAAKANRDVEGAELWSEDATFLGLVSTVYPHIDPSEWGL